MTVSVAALLFWPVNFLVSAMLAAATVNHADDPDGAVALFIGIPLLVIYTATAAKIWGFL